eukprot:5234217-Ditylum_brightwellii.AAC.1
MLCGMVCTFIIFPLKAYFLEAINVNHQTVTALCDLFTSTTFLDTLVAQQFLAIQAYLYFSLLALDSAKGAMTISFINELRFLLL